jgi:hypothetical protein
LAESPRWISHRRGTTPMRYVSAAAAPETDFERRVGALIEALDPNVADRRSRTSAGRR